MPLTPLTPALFRSVADHTLLAPGTTRAELEAFLRGARELGVARVCVSPSALPVDPGILAGLEIVTVVGFPSGAHRAEAKAAEAAIAVSEGAAEIDMVVNRALMRAGEWEACEDEIRAVREACPARVLKVIIESAALNDEQIVGACRAAAAAGADFVKTSTGFDPAGGASVRAVRLMRETVGEVLGVKASGGIRSAAAVRELWEAGATRFGVSATAAILADWGAADTDAGTGPRPGPEAADAGY
ncbi:deoxyribose-phosphate aldolase [Leucobacter massiliensis]|uniref:Deoxyribose-phosphate aldolase n=1 Tax=Leucobacter massiliensis TaxID=1686285 RepID=A0A2S9QK82_9MICO|nr:deoxyribose-phosphate aldolase [Leucobacter massiliensis]PRI10001.1 deoxyribose-phosphate aldolase [Leucobacter massiliensis]